jgi:hypothetical protein
MGVWEDAFLTGVALLAEVLAAVFAGAEFAAGAGLEAAAGVAVGVEVAAEADILLLFFEAGASAMEDELAGAADSVAASLVADFLLL